MHSLSAKNLSLNPIVIFLSAFDSRWKEGTLLLGWHKSRNLFTYKEDAWEQKTYLADQKLQRGIKLGGACFYTWGMKVLRETRTKKFRIKFDSPPCSPVFPPPRENKLFLWVQFLNPSLVRICRGKAAKKKIIRAMKEQSGISLRLLKWFVHLFYHIFSTLCVVPKDWQRKRTCRIYVPMWTQWIEGFQLFCAILQEGVFPIKKSPLSFFTLTETVSEWSKAFLEYLSYRRK